MVEAVYSLKQPMSKWVLSNIFHYLTIPEALDARLCSHRMDEACLIGFNIGAQDL